MFTLIIITLIAVAVLARKTKLVIWLCRKLAGSVGAAMVAFVGVFGASCVSLYSKEIVEQSAPYFTKILGLTSIGLPENWQLKLTFWLIVAAVVLIGMRELGLGAVIKIREKDLEGRISTLPPQSFLEYYGDGLKEIGEIRRGTKQDFAKGTLTSDELDASIRTVMKHILGMARLWDGISSDELMLYRSNIMEVVPPELMDDIRDDVQGYQELVLNSPFFLYGDNYSSRLDSASGLLLIESNRLTVTSNSHGMEPDEDVKPICLPFSYPGPYLQENLQPNLPGAPEALVSKSARYLKSTATEMFQWLALLREKSNRYDRNFAHKIREYYSKSDHAQSILSIPIVFNGKAMAVLNIYRNKDGIFRGEERAQQFAALMSPVCYHLAKMLSLSSRIA